MDHPPPFSQVRALAVNMARLCQFLMPHISVNDGFIGMEGEGPLYGTPINLGVTTVLGVPSAHLH